MNLNLCFLLLLNCLMLPQYTNRSLEQINYRPVTILPSISKIFEKNNMYDQISSCINNYLLSFYVDFFTVLILILLHFHARG